MKIPLKTEREVEIMTLGGEKLGRILGQVLAEIKPGVKLSDLDRLAEKLIKKENGKPSFKMVPNYFWTTCININEGVVHGVPGPYQIKDGDVVSVDVGMFYDGFHTDMARTMIVKSEKPKGVKNDQKEKFLKAGQESLKEAIFAARSGNRVGHISQAIEGGIKKKGFFPVKNLTGHGVGCKLHEPPSIHCFLNTEIEATPILKTGMVLAIEVIYTQRETGLLVQDDGWTVKTRVGDLGGVFENTVLVAPEGAKVLTILPN